jgi:MSHA biogenesis protein MshI
LIGAADIEPEDRCVCMTFGVNTKGWTIIDSGGGPSLCAVSVKTAVRANERPQVIAVAEHPAPDREEGAALRDLARGVDRGLPILVTLARSEYKLRVMPEPAVPPREMLSSLRWSLTTEGDMPVDDIDLAWLPIPTTEQLPARPAQGYAVIVGKVSVASRMTEWRHLGLRPKVVDIRETALRNIAGALERPGEGLALLSVESEGVAMVFTHQGSLYLDRFVEQPLAELQGAGGAARTRLFERIAVQLLRSIDVIARTYPFMPVTRVVVAPEPEGLGLRDYLSEQLPVTIDALDLAEVFDLAKVPVLAQSPALQARCLVALGASLRSAKAAA